MMKGIRGLLEKDFRLFFRQGGNLFFGVSVCSIVFLYLREKRQLLLLQCISHLFWRYIQVIRSVMMKMTMATHIYFLYL